MPPLSQPVYAELYCRSSFSFGLGASNPEELVARAHALGYAALALTDECTVAGVVRAHVEARRLGLKLLLGAEFAVPSPLPAVADSAGFRLIVLAHNLTGWGNLCTLITQARRRAPKGHYRVGWPDVAWGTLQHCEVLLVFDNTIKIEAAISITESARSQFGSNLWLVLVQLLLPDDVLLQHKLQQIATLTGVPLLAAGAVLMHVRSRKPLQDVLTAVRLGKPVAECGLALQPNAENHLRAPGRLTQLYPARLVGQHLAGGRALHLQPG
jgi:error-prone DNA polymerase